MKRLSAIISLALLCLSTAAAGERPLRVIATLFPQYDFAKQIGQEKVSVTLLLPPGSESHSFEPTPGDMKEISAADLFIYTGEQMEPWAKRLADAAASGVRIVDASAGVRLGGGHAGHVSEHSHDGHDHAIDPHIWLDPVMAGTMAENIGAALAETDRENAEFYLTNTHALRDDLERLHNDITERISGLPRRLLIFGDRFAFGYFFSRYGLESASPYKFCAAGAEPGLRAVIETIEAIKREGVSYIYVEEMTTSKMADVIRGETGVRILRVESLHNPPLEKQTAGLTYQSGMRDNLDAFSKGLE